MSCSGRRRYKHVHLELGFPEVLKQGVLDGDGIVAEHVCYLGKQILAIVDRAKASRPKCGIEITPNLTMISQSS